MSDPDPSSADERPVSAAPSTAASHPQPVDLEQQQQQPPQLDLSHDAVEEPSAPEPAPASQPFQSLFTLVTDATTRQTHHPHVHYIFADDDPEILSDALSQYSRHQHQVQQYQLLLQQQHQQQYHQYRTSSSSSRENIRASASASGSGSSISNKPPLAQPPAPPPPAPPRAVVLDLIPRIASKSSSSDNKPTAATTGYDVAWASSLSSDWAVLSAKVSPMSSTDAAASVPGAQASSEESDDGSTPAPPRLMLRIEGMGVPSPPTAATAASAAGARARTSSAATGTRKRTSQESMSGSGVSGAATVSGVVHGQDYSTVVEEFDRRMGLLRKVVDAGTERQAKMAAAEARHGDGEVQSGLPGMLGVDDRAASAADTTSTSGEHGREEEQEQAEARQLEREDASSRQQGEPQPGSSREVL